MKQQHPKGAEYFCDGLYYKRSLTNNIFMFINEGWTRSQKTWDEIIDNKHSMNVGKS